MRRIYLDNGSTSFPKAPGVGDAMKEYLESNGCNLSRGGYASAYSLAGEVLAVREELASLFHFDQVTNVVFTPSVTYSLNFLLKGLLRPGDHVITSSMEHNAIARPMAYARDHGQVELTVLPCSQQGELTVQTVEQAIRPNTRLVVMTHASNVCGTLLPLKEVGEVCGRHQVFFIADTAQSAGVEPIDFYEMNLSALAFTGHKGLLGPQGIGGFLIADELAEAIVPVIQGGTGSISDQEVMPEFLPDKFEAGTVNIPGILGLGAALKFLKKEGVHQIRSREQELTNRFLSGVVGMKGIRVAGKENMEHRAGIVSLDFLNQDNGEVAYLLDSQYGISTRCGMHCAPWAHRTLSTYPQGTVRFAFGWANTKDEVDAALEAVRQLG